MKIKNLSSFKNDDTKKLCAEFNADSKSVLVFVLALIVLNFYSFEIPKMNNQKKKNTKILTFLKMLNAGVILLCFRENYNNKTGDID